MANVLVIGKGAREHAIIHRLVQSLNVTHLYTVNNSYFKLPYQSTDTPGYDKITNLEYKLEEDQENGFNDEIDDYLKIALNPELAINFVLVGPENYLANGIKDLCDKHNIPCFGPTQSQAKIESSKIYSKDIMQTLGLPTADYRSFTHLDKALTFYRENFEASVGYNVIKEDGLAGGKGVLVSSSIEKGEEFITQYFTKHCSSGNEDGPRILIEKCLHGKEVSVLAFCNGNRAYLMPTARDFKRVYDGNKGPNTGGMGAFCPGNLLNPDQLMKIQRHMDNVVVNLGYVGVLYAGLMISDDGSISFLEFNCRFGDPETQAILPLLHPDCDLFEIMQRCVNKESLDGGVVKWTNNCTINVVLSHIDYPYRKLNNENATEVTFIGKNYYNYLRAKYGNNVCELYNANITYNESDGKYYTTGGRVMSVVICMPRLLDCFNTVYRLCELVSYIGINYRRDIAREYIIHDSVTKRLSYVQRTGDFVLTKIPTIAFFQSNDSKENAVLNTLLASVINSKTDSNIKTKFWAKPGVVVCYNTSSILYNTAIKHDIPVILLPTRLNSTYINVIDLLRAYDIDMILYNDYKEFMQYHDSIKYFDVEFGTNQICVDSNLHNYTIADGCIRDISKITYYVRAKNKLHPLYVGQIINDTSNLFNINSTCQIDDYKELFKSTSFIEYIMFYNMQPLNYRVDINEGNEFVEYLGKLRTPNNCDLIDTNGFCSVWKNYSMCTDGVGTKLDLALKYNMLEGIGIDLVAMCANDMYVHGAKPTAFLDYLAVDRMDKTLCKTLVDSINKGCKIAGCSLTGGETAEMKGMYRSKKCDLGGFLIGDSPTTINHICSNDDFRSGMHILGLPSSGIHSNGFTLVNDILHNLDLQAQLDSNCSLVSHSLIKQLLKPTRIYSDVLKLIDSQIGIHGIAHITGGGFPDNINRLCKSFDICNLDDNDYIAKSIETPYCKFDFELDDMFDYLDQMNKKQGIGSEYEKVISQFRWVQRMSNMSMKDMLHTFNCGIGMVFIVDVSFLETVKVKGLPYANEFIKLGEMRYKDNQINL
jgi:phosphoribosylamine--glycine ligase/phosphoribosylaminoimidazole synthetase